MEGYWDVSPGIFTCVIEASLNLNCRDWIYSSITECLLCMIESLGLLFSSTKKKKNLELEEMS